MLKFVTRLFNEVIRERDLRESAPLSLTMTILFWLPLTAFILLLLGERLLGRQANQATYSVWDWALNLIGFSIQGGIIPICAYLVSVHLLPDLFPAGAQVLKFGIIGAFLLNFVFVDFLYYWEHRLFHASPTLWKLHECHHASRRVDLWATARNTVLTNFLFVYMVINPILGYLVDSPEAFYAGAMMTASLDLFRHSNIDVGRLPLATRIEPLIECVFVMPRAHHQHHSTDHYMGNYGANLIIWDRLFGSLIDASGYPTAYGVEGAPHPLAQLLFPFAGRQPNASRQASDHEIADHR